MSKQAVMKAASLLAEEMTTYVDESLTDLGNEIQKSLNGSNSDAGTGQSGNSQPTKKSWKLYDNIRYSGKPGHRELGLAPCKILYQGAFDIPDDGDLPSESHITSLSRRTDDELTCLDIEHPRWLNKNNWDFVGNGDNKYEQVAKWWGSANDSNQRFGFYGVTTARNVWDALAGPGKRKHDWWKSVNDRAKIIVDDVDVLFPTLYAFHDDIPTWEKYAKGNIDEARRTSGGRPVIPYIWPQFHSSAVDGTPRRGHIPAKHWRAQLEFCYEHCDGAVIWTLSSETKKVPWSQVPAFWPETEKFLKQL